MKINLDDRIIKDPIFTSIIPEDLTLDDIVLTYNNGKNWKIIPIDILLKYPIIHDTYYDQTNTRNGKLISSNITLVFSPYSFASIIYFSKIIPTNELYKDNLVLITSDGNYKFNQLEHIIYSKSGERINKFIRRHEAKIMIMRNVMNKYPDCFYLDTKSYKNNIEMIVQKDFMTNKFTYSDLEYQSNIYHPKTFVYGIEYKSSDVDYDNYKYSVIVSDDAHKDKPNSFDLRINKYEKYFDEMIDKIREKQGIIIPCFWYSWYNMFPKSKVIKL